MAKEMSGEKKATATKTIKKILISQAKPESEKSPYFDLERKYNVSLFFKPFIELEPIGVKDQY
jgi:uroporphyrinogen-III synthase